jgi:vacuolar-type H+-ATPase subunit I/STV1
LIDSKQNERLEGKSGYTFKKMLNLWLNGFTSFSIKPLRVSIVFGLIAAFIGVVVGIYVVIHKLVHPEVLVGWSSTIAVIMFMFGIAFVILGMIGEYVGRIYLCINKTPQFVVRQVSCKNGRKPDEVEK